MEGLSSKGLGRGGGFRGQPGYFGAESRPIDRIADQRVAGMGQMDAYLVGTASFQPAGEEARNRLAVGAQVTLQHLPVGDGFAAAGPDRHLVPGVGMPVDRLLDGPARPVGYAPGKGQIAAPERPGAAMIGKL